jgi:hypothetical protein
MLIVTEMRQLTGAPKAWSQKDHWVNQTRNRSASPCASPVGAGGSDVGGARASATGGGAGAPAAGGVINMLMLILMIVL